MINFTKLKILWTCKNHRPRYAQPDDDKTGQINFDVKPHEHLLFCTNCKQFYLWSENRIGASILFGALGALGFFMAAGVSFLLGHFWFGGIFIPGIISGAGLAVSGLFMLRELIYIKEHK